MFYVSSKCNVKKYKTIRYKNSGREYNVNAKDVWQTIICAVWKHNDILDFFTMVLWYYC